MSNINNCQIIHSAKGSTWDDHKYIKKVNGVYYYPKDYKGGRHAGDTKSGDISSEERYNKDDKDFSEAEEAWESTVYGDIDRIMRENPDLKDPVALARMAFDNNLKGKMSDAEIDRMMEKVKAHYSKSEKKEQGNSKSNKKKSNADRTAEALKKIGEAGINSVKKKKEVKHSEPDNELQHFGTKRHSGRYPWGSGSRPYQSTGGSSSETPEQREARKQQTLKSARSAIAIKEFANELSYQELDNALKRIELNQKLDKYAQAEREFGMRKVESAMKKVSTINNWGNTIIQSFNNVNAFVDLWNSIESAKKGEYKKYQQYVQQRKQEGNQQSQQGKKKK